MIANHTHTHRGMRTLSVCVCVCSRPLPCCHHTTHRARSTPVFSFLRCVGHEKMANIKSRALAIQLLHRQRVTTVIIIMIITEGHRASSIHPFSSPHTHTHTRHSSTFAYHRVTPSHSRKVEASQANRTEENRKRSEFCEQKMDHTPWRGPGTSERASEHLLAAHTLETNASEM